LDGARIYRRRNDNNKRMKPERYMAARADRVAALKILKRRMDMVKFTAKTKGKNDLPLLGLGICEENVQKLVKGQPLVVYVEQFRTNFNVVIVFGETNESVLASLKSNTPLGIPPGIDLKMRGKLVFMAERKDGFPWFGIGIDKEKMRELKEAVCIVKFDGKKYGISHDVLLFYQETMNDLARAVCSIISDDTIVIGV
jgi:hypothetical protein